MVNLSTFEPMIFREKEIPFYYVNKEGLIYSSKSNKILKTRIFKQTGRTSAKIFEFTIPVGFFSDYSYRKTGGRFNAKTETVTQKVHRAVAETFMPVEKNPPKEIKEYWDSLPNAVKMFIKSGLIVDHIDNDPTNNSLYNLRWTISRENAVHVKAKTFDVQSYYDSMGYDIVVQKTETVNLEKFYV